MRQVEKSGQWGTADAGRSFAANARHRLDGAVSGAIDPHAVVLGVGNQDISVRVDAQVLRAVQTRPERIPAVA